MPEAPTHPSWAAPQPLHRLRQPVWAREEQLVSWPSYPYRRTPTPLGMSRLNRKPMITTSHRRPSRRNQKRPQPTVRSECDKSARSRKKPSGKMAGARTLRPLFTQLRGTTLDHPPTHPRRTELVPCIQIKRTMPGRTQESP